MPIDNDCLAQVLLREREKLYAYSWAIVRDDELAEEILQEVALIALQKRDSIHDERHLAGWLRLAIRKRAYALARKRRARPLPMDNVLLDLMDAGWRRWDDAPSDALLAALDACLGTLTENSRELVELRYQQGMKSSQVAAQLGRNVQAVYVALTRIHTKLLECMRLRLGEGTTTKLGR